MLQESRADYTELVRRFSDLYASNDLTNNTRNNSLKIKCCKTDGKRCEAGKYFCAMGSVNTDVLRLNVVTVSVQCHLGSTICNQCLYIHVY